MMNAMPMGQGGMPMNPMMNMMPMMGMNPMMNMMGMNPMMNMMGMNPMMGMPMMMPMMGMNPMMGMPMPCKMTMEMTKDGMMCRVMPMDPAHMDMMKERMTMMMQAMQHGMPCMMTCGGMPMMMMSM